MLDLIIFLMAEGYTDSFLESLEILGIEEQDEWK